MKWKIAYAVMMSVMLVATITANKLGEHGIVAIGALLCGFMLAFGVSWLRRIIK